MDEQQCLLGGINDAVLGEIVRRMLHENNIKVHECFPGVTDPASFVSDDISCVIFGMGEKKLPRECEEILKKRNDLIIIELLNNGKSLSLYMDDIDEAVLRKIINIKA